MAEAKAALVQLKIANQTQKKIKNFLNSIPRFDDSTSSSAWITEIERARETHAIALLELVNNFENLMGSQNAKFWVSTIRTQKTAIIAKIQGPYTDAHAWRELTDLLKARFSDENLTLTVKSNAGSLQFSDYPNTPALINAIANKYSPLNLTPEKLVAKVLKMLPSQIRLRFTLLPATIDDLLLQVNNFQKINAMDTSQCESFSLKSNASLHPPISYNPLSLPQSHNIQASEEEKEIYKRVKASLFCPNCNRFGHDLSGCHQKFLERYNRKRSQFPQESSQYGQPAYPQILGAQGAQVAPPSQPFYQPPYIPQQQPRQQNPQYANPQNANPQFPSVSYPHYVSPSYRGRNPRPPNPNYIPRQPFVPAGYYPPPTQMAINGQQQSKNPQAAAGGVEIHEIPSNPSGNGKN